METNVYSLWPLLHEATILYNPNGFTSVLPRGGWLLEKERKKKEAGGDERGCGMCKIQIERERETDVREGVGDLNSNLRDIWVSKCVYMGKQLYLLNIKYLGGIGWLLYYGFKVR